MTKPDLTAIALIVDRSGSMRSIKDEAQGALNHFIDEQTAQPGEVLWTVVLFDHLYERPHFNVADHPGKVELEPRGMTALNDAIGRTVADLGVAFAEMSEDERPSKVLVAVLTDGHENHSTEFTVEAVRELVKRQQDEWGWGFIYLATGIDQFAADQVAAAYGYRPGQTVSVAAQDHGHLVNTASAYATAFRGAGGQSVILSDVADEAGVKRKGDDDA